jgi:hypothetical protein
MAVDEAAIVSPADVLRQTCELLVRGGAAAAGAANFDAYFKRTVP